MRVDNQDIPKLVQGWIYGPAETFEVILFNGKILFLDKWQIREDSLKGYSRWNEIPDQEAIDEFIEKRWDWFK